MRHHIFVAAQLCGIRVNGVEYVIRYVTGVQANIRSRKYTFSKPRTAFRRQEKQSTYNVDELELACARDCFTFSGL